MKTRFALVAAAAAVIFATAAAAQQTTLEARHMAASLERLRSRSPAPVFQEIEALVKAWDSLSWADRQRLEKAMLALDAMLPHQIREFFKDAEKKGEEEARGIIVARIDALAAGTEIPASGIKPSVVVVIVGGNVDSRRGFEEQRDNAPLIFDQIRPLGAFVSNIKSVWTADRENWIGEFLTGHSINGIVKDGQVSKFKSPTFLDLFRKISGAEARDSWIVSVGDERNIIFDYQEFVRGFEDKFKPTALTSYKLRTIDSYVQDHILSRRQENLSAWEILSGLKNSLTPGKLRLDIDFNNAEVQKFLRDVIAENGGQFTDSEGFVQRLGVRLLSDPVMAPRLSVFRFGGIPGLNDLKPAEKKAAMTAKMRDHDEAAYSLFRAFRSNPYYRSFGTFMVIYEGNGAIVVGPRIKPGIEVNKSYQNTNYLATIATLLGYGPDEFIAPCPTKPRKNPIEELFADK